MKAQWGKFGTLLAAFGIIFLAGTGIWVHGQKTQDETRSPGSFWPSEEISVEEEIADPASLEIPVLGVKAQILSVGLKKDGTMDTPKNERDVAWYKFGAVPGKLGNAVIAGHLDTRLTPKAVFFKLKELKTGDEVAVFDRNGKEIKFRVTGSKSYSYDQSAEEIFNRQSPNPEISLITCAGDWLPAKKTYSERLVVFAERI